MPKGSKKRPRDANLLAKRIVDIATGKVDEVEPQKDAKAQIAGRVGGAARAGSLTPERRSEIARKAARARWSKDG